MAVASETNFELRYPQTANQVRGDGAAMGKHTTHGPTAMTFLLLIPVFTKAL
jgi:hypothetical protein